MGATRLLYHGQSSNCALCLSMKSSECQMQNLDYILMLQMHALMTYSALAWHKLPRYSNILHHTSGVSSKHSLIQTEWHVDEKFWYKPPTMTSSITWKMTSQCMVLRVRMMRDHRMMEW